MLIFLLLFFANGQFARLFWSRLMTSFNYICIITQYYSLCKRKCISAILLPYQIHKIVSITEENDQFSRTYTHLANTSMCYLFLMSIPDVFCDFPQQFCCCKENHCLFIVEHHLRLLSSCEPQVSQAS